MCGRYTHCEKAQAVVLLCTAEIGGGIWQHGFKMLRNIGIAAGLIGALAASGAFLVAQAKPEPSAKAAPQSKAASAKATWCW